MEKIEFRTLTIEDYDGIVSVWKRAQLPFKLKGRESKQMIENQMKLYPDFFVGAFHGEKTVGVVIGSCDGRMKGWVNRLAVDPTYRRRGIARSLVKKLEKALEKHGVQIFCALIETTNEESLISFKHMGYAIHRNLLYASKRKSTEV